MKRYKVEAQNFMHSLGGYNDIPDKAVGWAQATIERYVRDGWTLASTNATSDKFAFYMFLYFERED